MSGWLWFFNLTLEAGILQQNCCGQCVLPLPNDFRRRGELSATCNATKLIWKVRRKCELKWTQYRSLVTSLHMFAWYAMIVLRHDIAMLLGIVLLCETLITYQRWCMPNKPHHYNAVMTSSVLGKNIRRFCYTNARGVKLNLFSCCLFNILEKWNPATQFVLFAARLASAFCVDWWLSKTAHLQRFVGVVYIISRLFPWETIHSVAK